jgi:hypothetical protein
VSKPFPSPAADRAAAGQMKEPPAGSATLAETSLGAAGPSAAALLEFALFPVEFSGATRPAGAAVRGAGVLCVRDAAR